MFLKLLIVFWVCWVGYFFIVLPILDAVDSRRTQRERNKTCRPHIIKSVEQPETNIDDTLPYKKKNLLTKTEYHFFQCLKPFCEQNNFIFCPKVRMEDFLDITISGNRSEKMRYRGYVKSRHIDFIICDANLHILCGIELDDSSHNTEKAMETDSFKNEVFQQIGIPLFRVKTIDNYSQQLERILQQVKHKNT